MTRFMIAGTNSGCGKTTVTCAILSALKKRGKDISAFKCGPDYIDPMFHRQAIGIPSHNLDCFFCNDKMLKTILRKYSGEVSIIEGVMGFYDGGKSSSYCISEITKTPVIIVIDCKGMSNSIGAVMKGFLDYCKPNNIAGFIFNRLSERVIPLAKKMCRELGTKYFGSFPKSDIIFESRQLGLVTSDEVENIMEKLDKLGELAEKYMCLDMMLGLKADELNDDMPLIKTAYNSPLIAVAKDNAFCFQYAENISLLEEMGCRIQYFSPIDDNRLPEADGLILCGGYPEIYVKKLSLNISMRESIKNAVLSGMPTIAECGGFMYLHRELTDENGKIYPMAGVIDASVFPTKKLQRFGYAEMVASIDNLLCRNGETIKIHEFHYWDSTSCGNGFTAKKNDGSEYLCCHMNDALYAGFPHLYFYSNIDIAKRFVSKCIIYGGKNG
ncbi:MAG: cobyrinate a,c-diamide synthase [Ruminococcus sp.]|nr:cobyrinate a,c-diamide synthase [Ruminococcus sp.]